MQVDKNILNRILYDRIGGWITGLQTHS